MIVWTGAGGLVFVIAVVAAGIGAVLGGTHPAAGGGLGLIAGSVAIWFLGKRLNGPGSTRVLIDQKTGEQVVLRRKHTMFWIPMEYWAVFLGLLAVCLIAYGLIAGPQAPATAS